MFQPSLKRLVAQSLGYPREVAVATALCVTSPAAHGWNKFQHSTALRAQLHGAESELGGSDAVYGE